MDSGKSIPFRLTLPCFSQAAKHRKVRPSGDNGFDIRVRTRCKGYIDVVRGIACCKVGACIENDVFERRVVERADAYGGGIARKGAALFDCIFGLLGDGFCVFEKQPSRWGQAELRPSFLD